MSDGQETYLSVVFHFLKKVPHVGEAVELLQETVFQSDAFDAIRSQTEDLIQKKIANADYLALKAKLDALRLLVNRYVQEVKVSRNTPTQIGNAFNNLELKFIADIPAFKDDRYKLALLPIFIQVITMYLTVLRDACLNGSTWGFSDEKIALLKSNLRQAIIDNTAYATGVFNDAISARQAERHELWNKRKGGDRTECVRDFTYWSRYHRELSLGVMDYVELWPQFNVDAEAIPALSTWTEREVYSDAFGGGVAEIPDPVSRDADLDFVTVWSIYRDAPKSTWVSALKMEYGKGAEAVVDQVEQPGSGAVQEGPMVGLSEIFVNSGGAGISPQGYARIYGLALRNEAGGELDCGSLNARRWDTRATREYAERIPVPLNHHISSLHATGNSHYIDTVYLGFRRNPPPPVHTISRFYQPGGDRVAHPENSLRVPAGWKILGGGARVNYFGGAGNMLTASYPKGTDTWIAKAKDHQTSNPGNVDVWAIAVYDPDDEWDVVVASTTSAQPSNVPYAQARLAPGYALTGGGAWVDYGTGDGNILTASYPEPNQHWWTAGSKAPDNDTPCKITAYAIGLRTRKGKLRALTETTEFEGAQARQPTAQVAVAAGHTLVGGGALVRKYGAGNFLTDSYPDFRHGKWIAGSKDHRDKSDPTRITAYAIGLRFVGT